MPCYSRIETKITNAERLAAALRELGYADVAVQQGGNCVLSGSTPLFERARASDSFSSTQYRSNLGAGDVAAIGKRYAALGVKAFAKSRGFGVVVDEPERIVLKNRRG
jgi:hypothetical protein